MSDICYFRTWNLFSCIFFTLSWQIQFFKVTLFLDFFFFSSHNMYNFAVCLLSTFFSLTQNSRLRQKAKKKSCYLYILLPYRYSTFLADTRRRQRKEKKKKRKKKLTKFQVLSFSNEWLTASLTAAEWWWGINVETKELADTQSQHISKW